jgi:hypothetical protein
MRLFEAILDTDYRALAGDASAGLHPAEFADALPGVVRRCIEGANASNPSKTAKWLIFNG